MRKIYRSRSEIKVVFGIIIRYSLYDLLKSIVILGIFALGYPGADKVTHNAAEVLVTGVGNEGAAVGKHTYEA